MSDLRTRIAAALKKADETVFISDPFAAPEPSYDELAEAVIAELGLIRDPFSTVAFCRYVTQWQPNERFAPYCQRCGIPHTEPCRRPADA
jgi:hypothetical protein